MSMRKCNVLGCRSHISTHHMHKFPTCEDRAEVWRQFCGNPALDCIPAKLLSIKTAICKKHFNTSQFTTPACLRLNRNAIPSLCPPSDIPSPDLSVPSPTCITAPPTTIRCPTPIHADLTTTEFLLEGESNHSYEDLTPLPSPPIVTECVFNIVTENALQTEGDVEESAALDFSPALPSTDMDTTSDVMDVAYTTTPEGVVQCVEGQVPLPTTEDAAQSVAESSADIPPPDADITSNIVDTPQTTPQGGRPLCIEGQGTPYLDNTVPINPVDRPKPKTKVPHWQVMKKRFKERLSGLIPSRNKDGRINVCLLCLKAKIKMVPIFQYNSLDGFAPVDALKDLLQIQVSANDVYPQSVCMLCTMKLRHFRQFKEQCESSINLLDRVYADGGIENTTNDTPEDRGVATGGDDRNLSPVSEWEGGEVDLDAVKDEYPECTDGGDLNRDAPDSPGDRNRSFYSRWDDVPIDEDSSSSTEVKIEIEEGNNSDNEKVLCYLECEDDADDVYSNPDETNKAGGPEFNSTEDDPDDERQCREETDSGEDSESHTCAVCRKRYKTLGHYRRHVERHHNEECIQCGKKYLMRYELVAHMRTHSEVTFNCPVCDKGFESIRLMKWHLKMHRKPLSERECRSLAMFNS